MDVVTGVRVFRGPDWKWTWRKLVSRASRLARETRRKSWRRGRGQCGNCSGHTATCRCLQVWSRSKNRSVGPTNHLNLEDYLWTNKNHPILDDFWLISLYRDWMNKYHPNNMEEFFFKSSGIRRPFPSSFGTIIIYGRPFVSKIGYRPHSIRYRGMAILEYINSIIE